MTPSTSGRFPARPGDVRTDCRIQSDVLGDPAAANFGCNTGGFTATDQKEIVAGTAAIVEEVTGIEPSEVTIERSFVDDLDIDSLSLVEIAVQLEDKYGVKIPDEDMQSPRTVGDAVAYVQKMESEDTELATELQARAKEGLVE